MRAKMDYANGDHPAAMTRLEQAIRSDPKNATEFTNSGKVKPEKSASVCVWTEPEIDALVARFPSDYRSHMFRGLYFSKFAPLDKESLRPAIESLTRAAQLNPRSALPQLFKAMLLGDHFVFFEQLRQLGWADAERDKLDAELVAEYGKAITLDPNLLPALRGRALAQFHLKRFQEAIADYNKVLALDSQDYASLHDRGLAKAQLGNYYDAIFDFSAAIKIRPRELQEHQAYESRADSYMKTRQWDLAIRDLTTAISLQVGGHVFSLMSIGQFRAIYPEYKTASDEMVARKLHQTFHPNLTYEGYSDYFLNHSGSGPSFILAELYLKRSDVHLKKGNWRQASIDFRRVMNGFGSYSESVERWREIAQTSANRNYIDMKTFDYARSESVKLWVKEAAGADVSAPYSLVRFELDCSARRMRTLSFASYDETGRLTASREGGIWQAITPDTLGETLYDGACS